MEIVPIGDDLLIEGKVKPSDIAFLHLGQAASVKVDAYDFSIYGHLPGELVFISADTMIEQEGNRDEEPYYRVRIRTGRQFTGLPDRQLEILPGMTATVEIKTGRRSGSCLRRWFFGSEPSGSLGLKFRGLSILTGSHLQRMTTGFSTILL